MKSAVFPRTFFGVLSLFILGSTGLRPTRRLRKWSAVRAGWGAAVFVRGVRGSWPPRVRRVRTPRAPLALSSTLAFFLGLAPPAKAQVSIGALGAWTKTQGGQGTVSGGAVVRLKVPVISLALEGAALYRKEDFQTPLGFSVQLEQIPVQVSLLIHLIPLGPTRLYILGGAGWYHNKVLGITENTWGPHAGAGVDVRLGKRLLLTGDLRYCRVSAPLIEDLTGISFSYTQASAAVSFVF